MSEPIVPLARSLFLCESYRPAGDGRLDLLGTFTRLRLARYPHARPRLVAYVQLSGGWGDTSLFFEVRRERDDELVRTTAVRTVRFTDRATPVNVAMAIEGITFTEPGVYVVSLFCNNVWVCDTAVSLL